MKIDNNILLQYKKELESITQIDNALRRIETVALYFDRDITEQERKELDALKEYAVFVECVKRPFFNILHSAFKTPGTIEKVLGDIKNKKFDFFIPLRHEEIWHLFRSIGVQNITHIIDTIDMSTAVREKMIQSLRNVSKDDFLTALQDYDFGELAKNLWRLRYILYGVTSHLEGSDLNDRLSSYEWTLRIDFRRFFLPLSEREEQSVIKKSVAALGRIPFGVSVNKMLVPDMLFIESITKNRDYKSFYDFKVWKNMVGKEDIHMPENIFVNFSYYARTTRRNSLNYTDRILRTSLRKDDAYAKFESMFHDWGKIVQKEADATTGPTMEELSYYLDKAVKEDGSYEIRPPMKEEMVVMDFRTHTINKYKKTPFVDVSYYDSESGTEAFGKDIMLYSFAMCDVFNSIRFVLDKNVADILEWIIGSCVYTKRMNELYSNDYNSKNTYQSNKPKHTIDTNKDHKNNKWYVRVRDSKIPKEAGFPDDVLCSCLEKLYYMLIELGHIDKNTNIDLFIYRFSGIGKPYSIDNKINWNGKRILLGHIVRCLTSDKYNPPMDMAAIAKYFISKTGKDINLASASYQHIEDSLEEDIHKKKSFEPLFVEAVKLLRKCDFINVEFTSKRR